MHTQIAIDEVFYGHSARTAEICAGASTKKRTTTEGRNGTKRKVDYNVRTSSSSSLSNDSCEVPEALLFATETCQNKRRCWIKTGARDPALNDCSHIGRHFQVSYRCRPSQFNGEFFCDNQLMSLSCLEGQRLAIHSAFYRSVPPKGSGNCQKTPSDLYIDCSTDVLSIVVERCHARKECQLHVGPSLFHSSCPDSVNKQLVVVFICGKLSINDVALTMGCLCFSRGGRLYR
ncbi:hypothetical protein D918_04367 [Trichuris suis]|nr:hypothetical protein D918_04367 [Trichuris suis]